ncbi:MAG: hypothetical protein KDB98_12600, partial [Flavobacteriales bacterium]|nr:hypothetical protein [Flavobacteriales bacterium]
IDKSEELGFVEEPLAGDVCEFKTEDNDYSIFRIVDVTADSLVVLYNDYVSDRSTSLHQLNKDSCFTDLYFIISREEFEGMHADGTIYGITRD